MSILKQLQNPFVLGAQGFVLGAALFFSSGNKAQDERPMPPQVAADTALIKSFGA